MQINGTTQIRAGSVKGGGDSTPITLTDTFDRPSGDPLNTITGTAFTWVEQVGDWIIDSNGAALSASVANSIATIETALTNTIVTATIGTIVNGNIGLGFRFDDADNFWFTTTTGLWKRVAGTNTLVTSWPAYIAGDTISAEISGPFITIKNNGVPIGSAFDGHAQTETRHGIYSSTAGNIIASWSCQIIEPGSIGLKTVHNINVADGSLTGVKFVNDVGFPGTISSFGDITAFGGKFHYLTGVGGSSNDAFITDEFGQPHNPFRILGSGKMFWGTAATAPDVSMERLSSGTMGLDGSIHIAGPLPWADIKAPEYGAVGNGVADDAPAIIAAIAAVDAAGGGWVYIPAGTYLWNGVISVPSKVNLVGAGPFAVTLVAGNAAAQIRFGDGGGVTTTINNGGQSGGFRINGAAATNPLFIGLCVARSFTDIDIIYALGDCIRVEQAQNCYFREVNTTRATGSNLVEDYGSGGHKFDKCEFYGAGRSNYRSAYTAANVGGGYTSVSHTTFDTCLFEGTQASTIACVEIEAGTRRIFHNCHMTLFSGANGHADLYGTDIPVLSVSKAHADPGAVSNRILITGGTQIWGSKPASSSVYKGVGIQITNTPGEANTANVYIEQGTRIVFCSAAFSTQASSRIDITGSIEMGSNTERYRPISGTHSEPSVIRRPGNVIDVREYGAVGDGSANDTAAINAALVAASVYGTATKRIRVVFPDGIYLTDGVLAQPNVWLDAGNAHIKKRVNGTSINTNCLLRAVETLIGATYYGTYKNMKVTGGLWDSNGFDCPAHIIRLMYCEDLEMVGVRVKHTAAVDNWAFAIGGRRIHLNRLTVTDGTVIFQDGIHIVHGQDITITGSNVNSGDDALSLGGEPTDTYLSADPDPIRRVTVVGGVLNSARVACVKIYVQSGAPDNEFWEVTDVTIVGWTGWAKGMAPVVVRDQNNKNRIRDIKVLGFTAAMGNSPTVASSAFPGTPYGVHAQSVDRLEVAGNIEIKGDNTAPSGWRLAWVEKCLRPEIKLNCRSLTSGGGVELVDCTDALVEGHVTASGDVNAPMVRITSSPGTRINAYLLGQKSGHNVVEVQSPGTTTTVQATGGKWSHAAGATAGNAFAYVSTTNVAGVDLNGVDLSGCFNAVPTNYWLLPHKIKQPHLAMLSAGATVASLPAPTSSWRGKMVCCQAGSGVADQWFVCVKNAIDAYEWAPVAQLAAEKILVGEAEIDGALNHDGTTVGFYGVTPVTRPAAYTQTYNTTSRTHAAYTADDESAAYTGAADGEAKLADLNALRVAYENLRVAYESTSKVLNQVLDDLQANGTLQ